MNAAKAQEIVARIPAHEIEWAVGQIFPRTTEEFEKLRTLVIAAAEELRFPVASANILFDAFVARLCAEVH